jgi:cell wall-associated NlpC family hydrolase
MKYLISAIVMLAISACSSTPARHGAHAQVTDAQMNEAVMYALSLADTPYHFGGNSPNSGFDCSGFVDHVYKEKLGIMLPRTSREISHIGSKVGQDQLQTGDLVFFNTLHQSFSHVGIYVGDGKFVHAPKSGSSIRTELMKDSYWLNRYNGARRIR